MGQVIGQNGLCAGCAGRSVKAHMDHKYKVILTTLHTLHTGAGHEAVSGA